MFDPKLEVPSLELCQRLKELGYPQEDGGWYWTRFPLDRPWQQEWELNLFYIEKRGAIPFKYYIKAPTCRELGEWLGGHYTTIKQGDSWCGVAIENLRLAFLTNFKTGTEPNARAKMVIWLRENGYIKFEEEDD